MNTEAPSLTVPSTISDVERDTGVAKETLRVWERRYDFPQPLRDPLRIDFYLLALDALGDLHADSVADFFVLGLRNVRCGALLRSHRNGK